jgi:hypothetical protein
LTDAALFTDAAPLADPASLTDPALFTAADPLADAALFTDAASLGASACFRVEARGARVLVDEIGSGAASVAGSWPPRRFEADCRALGWAVSSDAAGTEIARARFAVVAGAAEVGATGTAEVGATGVEEGVAGVAAFARLRARPDVRASAGGSVLAGDVETCSAAGRALFF